MNPVFLFHTNIDLTWELSGCQRQPTALVKSDAVEFPLRLLSTPSYTMTAIQPPVHPFSPAELDTERGKLVFWLLSIEGALAFGLCSISWRSKDIWDDSGCIFRAPECFMCQWTAVYAFSFRLPSFIELWRDRKRRSAFIIRVWLWHVGHQCIGRLGYGWSEVVFFAALLRWFSWLRLLLMWLLRLRLLAVRLDFWMGGAVKKVLHAVRSSVLWGQRLDLGLKSWL